jgi:hypothetical protein
MSYVDIALVEWPDGREGGCRLLGRVADPDLIDAVRDRLVASRRAEIARLERGEKPHNLRPIRGEGDGD